MRCPALVRQSALRAELIDFLSVHQLEGPADTVSLHRKMIRYGSYPNARSVQPDALAPLLSELALSGAVKVEEFCVGARQLLRLVEVFPRLLARVAAAKLRDDQERTEAKASSREPPGGVRERVFLSSASDDSEVTPSRPRQRARVSRESLDFSSVPAATSTPVVAASRDSKEPPPGQGKTGLRLLSPPCSSLKGGLALWCF